MSVERLPSQYGYAGNLKPLWIYGWDSQTIDFITNEIYCYICGNHIVFIALEGNEYQGMYSCPGTGLQAFKTNCVEHIFAYSEIAASPTIFLIEFPSLEIIGELEGGAELEIKCLAFSWEDHIASLSGAPDFRISVWRFTTKEQMCSVRVGESIIPPISFNPCNAYQMCTMKNHTITMWDIFRYNQDYIITPIDVKIKRTEMKQPVTKEHLYPQLKLPTFGFDPPDKYTRKYLETGFDDLYTQPTAHCWLPHGDVLVGTATGEIWKVDAEKHELKLVWVDSEFLKRTQDMPEELPITSLALHRQFLFVGTGEGVLLKLQMTTPMNVIHYVKLHSSIIRMRFALDHKNLIIGCKNGSIRVYPVALEKPTPTILFRTSPKLIAADFLPPWNKYVVTLDDHNNLHTLRFDDGQILSSLKLPLSCKCLVCSPMWYGAVVGSTTGVIFIMEYSKYPNPRMIHIASLDKAPIHAMKFDNSGYILYIHCGMRIFFLSGRPSANFSVFGYVNTNANVIDMDSWVNKNGTINFVFLSKAEKTKAEKLKQEKTAGRDKQADKNLNSVFTTVQLPKTLLAATARNITTIEGTFNEHIPIRVWTSPYDHSSFAADSADHYFYATIPDQKTILRFALLDPQPSQTSSLDSSVQIPEPTLSLKKMPVHIGNIFKSYHELSQMVLTTNLNNSQIVTLGADGLLIARFTSKTDTICTTYCDHFLGKMKQKVSLSKSGRHILVITADGFLLLYTWNYGKLGMDSSTKGTPSAKSTAFKELPECTRENMAARLKPAYTVAQLLTEERDVSTSLFEESEMSISEGGSDLIRIRKDQTQVSNEVIEMPDFDSTWLESKLATKEKLDAEATAWERTEIKKKVKSLGYEVARLLVENDLLPKNEQIPRQEFDLDWDRQRELKENHEQILKQIRDTTLQDNLLNKCLWNMIKEECWDAMSTKGKSIKAFLKDINVVNFPLRIRSNEELKKLEEVKLQREVEIEDHRKLVKVGHAVPKKWMPVAAKADQAADDNRDLLKVHLGSQVMEFGGDSPLFYSQFELFTKDQKHRQIVLLQDAIYRLKENFNRRFEEMYQKKELAIAKVTDRNNRMQQIMDDIKTDVNQSAMTIWAPSWSSEENPEECLIVHDSEIRAEKYYTPEERAKMAQKQSEEEEMKRRRQADDFRLRALDKMMGGVLQVRREDEIFKKDISVPAFVLYKPEEQWNQDEKAEYSKYETLVKEMNEERDKLRKQLEAEFQRAKINVQEIAETFDVAIEELFQTRLDTQMAVYQEELKLLRLNLMLAIEEDINEQHEFLLNVQDNLKHKKKHMSKEVAEIQKALQQAHEAYDTVVVEEKLQDKYFKREFGDAPPAIHEVLQKMLRRRPKYQKDVKCHPCQQSTTKTDNPYGPGPFGTTMLKQMDDLHNNALKELDDINHKPDVISTIDVWEEFCHFRRGRIQLEHQVKEKSIIIADMMSYLHRKQQDNDKIGKEIIEVGDLITRMLQEKRRVLMDLDVQLILKQGQVELEPEGFIPDFSGSILVHRRIVEEMNKHIKQLGAIKIEGMRDTLRLENMIALQEWEHEQKKMKIDDLISLAKEIQRFQVNDYVKKFLNTNQNVHMHTQQLAKLEETYSMASKMHRLEKQAVEKLLERAEKISNQMTTKNANMDQEIESLNSLICRWKLIPNITEPFSTLTFKNFEELSRRQQLKQLANAQYIELLELHDKLTERMVRTFPLLDNRPNF